MTSGDPVSISDALVQFHVALPPPPQPVQHTETNSQFQRPLGCRAHILPGATPLFNLSLKHSVHIQRVAHALMCCTCSVDRLNPHLSTVYLRPTHTYTRAHTRPGPSPTPSFFAVALLFFVSRRVVSFLLHCIIVFAWQKGYQDEII